MGVVNEFLGSKKFWAALVGVVVTVLVQLIPALEEMQESLTEILLVIASYIIGQGLADFGKSAK